MRKLFFALLIFILAMGSARAQHQLENPGFESWEDVLVGGSDTIREPAEWSSLKTSDDNTLTPLAPVVCKRSSEAHSGNYSVKLTNVLTLLVANGTVTNGRVHPNLNTSLAYMYSDTLDSKWHTPFTSKPDSFAGWFKYIPQSGDQLEIRVILHQGVGKQPDNDSLNNWIAQAHFKSPLNTGSQWLRFSTPFTYYNDKTPQYVLVVLNSGNGFFPVAGSIAWLDDLEMIYNNPQVSVDNQPASTGMIYMIGKQCILIQGFRNDNFSSACIMDITGRIVWKNNEVTDRMDISQSGLKDGIYLVSLYGKNGVVTQKIMIR